VLAREELRELVHVRFDQFAVFEHDARAALRVRRGPCRLRGLGGIDRLLQFLGRAELDLRLHFAAVGVEDVAGAAAGAVGFAGDEMIDVTQHAFPSWVSSLLRARLP
jgi:hypothetical protein